MEKEIEPKIKGAKTKPNKIKGLKNGFGLYYFKEEKYFLYKKLVKEGLTPEEAKKRINDYILKAKESTKKFKDKFKKSTEEEINNKFKEEFAKLCEEYR